MIHNVERESGGESDLCGDRPIQKRETKTQPPPEATKPGNTHGMQILNLTPHPLTLVGENGTLSVPPSGQIARLAVTRTALSPITVDGVTIHVSRPTLGDIVGLPSPEPGVILVVSALVAEAANRGDVMSPGELLRDSSGNVIGARGLCAYGKGDAQ